MDPYDPLKESFYRGWDDGVQCAFDIIKQVLIDGADLDKIKRRLVEELEMEDTQ